MRFEIVLAPQAVEDLGTLKANIRSAVKDALETHLRHEPMKTSRSRARFGSSAVPGSVSVKLGYSMMYRLRALRFWRS